MRPRSEKFLVAYSGLLTLVFAVTVLTGATRSRDASFEVIDVERINVREPDGTLRMAISSRDRFPGGIVKGHEYEFDRGIAGMIFYNDEGTETGGLSFSGREDENGLRSGVHLSFDPYERDQTVQLTERQNGGVESATLIFRDTSDVPIVELLAGMEEVRRLPADARGAEIQRRWPHGSTGPQRLVVGKHEDQRALVDLRDAEGRSRLRMAVTPEGRASIEFLDADGKVAGTITPESLAR